MRKGNRKHSAGFVISPLGVARVSIPAWRKRAQAADAAAIDRGETRTMVCWFRGLYGSYRREFYSYFLDLTPQGLVLRKYVLFRLRWTVPVTEGLEAAWLRPTSCRKEALRVGTRGTPGSAGVAANQIVCCRTTEGILEFAVKLTDVPLLLHYVTMIAHKQHGIAAEH